MIRVRWVLVVASLCACFTTAPDVGFAAGPVAATAAAPSLTEGSANSFSSDLAGNVRVALGTLLACEDQTNSLCMTSGGAVRSATMASAVTTNTTSSAVAVPTGTKTFYGSVDGTGAITQTQVIYGGLTSGVTGTKAVLSKFTNQIVMAEGLAEIYLPYVDIAYLSTPNTNASTAIGLFGYIYGDAPGAHIVGYSGSSLSSCTAPAHRARATFSHDAVMFSSGFTCDFLLAKPQHALDLKRYYYGAGTVPAATREVRN